MMRFSRNQAIGAIFILVLILLTGLVRVLLHGGYGK
jgi:hypothetical protein